MSASARYERPLMDSYSGFAEVDWRHASSRLADFELGSPRSNMPSYDIFDLRAGVDAPKWSFTLYVKNVANEIAINYVTPNTLGGGFGAQAANVYTPRTYGATVTAKF
jgi:outer membrane receptor protein involved in Fe transport